MQNFPKQGRIPASKASDFSRSIWEFSQVNGLIFRPNSPISSPNITQNGHPENGAKMPVHAFNSGSSALLGDAAKIKARNSSKQTTTPRRSMTYEITPWGYSTESLDSIISVADFKLLTGGGFSSSDEQIQATLNAVSYAVRNFCHWHVAPTLNCAWQGDADGALIQLPAMNLTAVNSVTVNGTPLASSDYAWRSSGLIRLAHPLDDDWGRRVAVEFEAGVNAAAIGAVVAQVTVNQLVAPAGVMREQAGDVSVTYNQTANGVTGGIRLITSDKQMLVPYRLPNFG